MVDNTVITDLVLGSLNAQITSTGYIVYGMAVTNQSVDTAIELARRNLLSLVGEDSFNNAINANIFESYITDMACMRLCINMLGIAIGTHFNYKTTDLSISKNVNPSLEEMLRQFEKSINQWIRLILKDNWTSVINQDDIVLDSIIKYNGVTYISRDSDAMSGYNRR